MRNSTSTHLPHLFYQKIFIKLFIAVALLLQTLYSIGQRTDFIAVYVPNPLGIVDPSHPTGAPQQFTTNLVNGPGQEALDGNLAVLDNSFSNSLDIYDAVKTVNNPTENFSLVRFGTNLVIEERQQVTTTDTLYYNMWNLKVQDYALEFFPINMVKPGLTAVLVDRFLNTRTAISLATAPTYYPFSVTADAASAASDRFILILFQADQGPLPVSFISVAAAQSSTGVQVSWKVAGERAILHYNIEKSADGRSFNSIGTLTATGSGYVDKDIAYSFKDNVTPKSIQYYRIKSTGANGEAKYSPIVKLSAGSVRSAIGVLPNPVRGYSMNLQLTKVPKGRYEINLSGTDGKLVFTDYIQHSGDNASYPVALPGTVSRGTYILSIISPDNTRQSQVVVVDQGN